jgi:meso-butanediol dehydrogenase/(S,S)-butanediol dehydrogenase/diacetyl reductase
MRGLKGKRVLITGGAGGIGSATARRFLEEGATVVILDRDVAACRRIKKAIPAISSILLADVSDPDSLVSAFDELDRTWDGLDILINNAGISFRQPIMEIMSEQWRAVIDTNLSGIFYVAQQAARRMLAGYAYYADYNASKAGVIELTRSMALELAPHIRVNVVCPGFILTPMQEAEYTLEMRQAYENKLPLRRLGRPEDVAALFVFLASDDASFITGQAFVIDGGEIAGGLASQL